MRAAVGAALVAAVGLLAVSGCTAFSSQAGVRSLPTTGWHGIPLPVPYPKPTLQLRDMNGAAFRIDRDARRPVVLVTFGYTHCRSVCASVLTELAAAVRPLDPGTRGRIQVLYVTVDPRRDTPAVLRRYLSAFDPTFLGLTGSTGQIRELGEELGVPITPPQGTGPGYRVPHGNQVVGFGPDGLAHLIWMPGTGAAGLQADLVRLASSS